MKGTLNYVADLLLRECSVDYQDISSIPFTIREEMGISSVTRVADLSVQLLEAFLDEEWVELGDLDLEGDKGFQSWNVGAKDALRRVTEEWGRLGREPQSLEIGWIRLTGKGRMEAEERIARWRESGRAEN